MSTKDDEGFDLVDKLLKDAGFALGGDDQADEFHRRMLEQLEIIGETKKEADSGGARVALPSGNHLRVGGTVWPLLTCAVAFVLAPLDPSGLTYAAAGGAVVNALKELAKVFHKLDPAQRVVCRAVLEVARAKKKAGKEPEASVDELESHFKANKQVVPIKLSNLITDLVKLDVLKGTNYPDAGTFYRVTF